MQKASVDVCVRGISGRPIRKTSFLLMTQTAVEFPPIHQWIGHPEVHRETLKCPNFADQGLRHRDIVCGRF